MTALSIGVCSILLVALAVPVLQVFLLRKGPVVKTPLMRRRRREAKADGRADFGIDIRWVDEMNGELVKAAIAVEDPTYLSHHGINFYGVRLSIGELLRTGKVTFGHSTITNQLARNVFLTLRKHYWRKALEFYYSILLELIWGKRRIMEVYLNVIEMGDGIFGCEAAALHHFGKHARDLSFHESVLLAVAFRNPRRFSPSLFQSGDGWWTEVIKTCEWMGLHWKAPVDERIWSLRGGERTCPHAITSAENIVKRMKKLALERKTTYQLGGIGAPTGDGGFAFDSSGLIKSDLWGWKGSRRSNGGAVYCSNGMPDINANAMIALCRDVSFDFSDIQLGELVWLEGHVGLYVGDGLVVESTPKWENGVQITACNRDHEGYPRRDWVKHGKFPFIYYAVPIPARPRDRLSPR